MRGLKTSMGFCFLPLWRSVTSSSLIKADKGGGAEVKKKGGQNGNGVDFLSSRGRALLSYCCCDLYFIHLLSSLHITGHKCVSSTCEESFLLCYLIACVGSPFTSPPPSSLPSHADALWALTHVLSNGAARPSLLKLPMDLLTAFTAFPFQSPPPPPPLIFPHPIWRKNQSLAHSQSAAAVKLLSQVGQEELIKSGTRAALEEEIRVRK